MKWVVLLCCFLSLACQSGIKLNLPQRTSTLSGREFYRQAVAMKWKERDSLALREMLAGNIPGFLRHFVPVRISLTDSASGKVVSAVYYVAPDYLSIGTDDDWARIPLTPMAAQRIADQLDCFLPTRKMVDDIYRSASLKLEPVPMYAYRDSTVTMWHHHLIIEGQRRGRQGLISGIKKDLVISGKITRDGRPDRVAIYGWHKLDAHAIQPLYTGHINWWVDYSHGIRLVYKKIRVNGRWMNYEDVLNDPVLRRLLCDEAYCDFYRYAY